MSLANPGIIYLVATPIGNLADISLRALEILKHADVVASEDTRKTGLLLKHYNIKKTQISFHEHNENRALEKIMSFISKGKSVALATDAGTPGISDPGFTLVRRAIEENIHVTMIPGPSAFVMSLVLSGLPLHSFTFRGFPPRKPGKRRRFLEADKDSPHTLIYYESPYRLKAFLRDAIDVMGDRKAAVTKELTKKFEKVARGSISELLEQFGDSELKGEYTVVMAGLKIED